MNAIALPTSVLDLINEYQDKHATIEAAIEAVNTAIGALHANCYIMPVNSRPAPSIAAIVQNIP